MWYARQQDECVARSKKFFRCKCAPPMFQVNQCVFPRLWHIVAEMESPRGSPAPIFAIQLVMQGLWLNEARRLKFFYRQAAQLWQRFLHGALV
jgi:hypothetical protein